MRAGSKKFNDKVVRQWIETNTPLGLEKLALKSGVSPSTIRYALRGKPPVRVPVRRQLCLALGVAESDLFPA